MLESARRHVATVLIAAITSLLVVVRRPSLRPTTP
jgi:hypothetical protein